LPKQKDYKKKLRKIQVRSDKLHYLFQAKYDDILEKTSIKAYQITKRIKKQEKYQVEIDSIKTFFAIIVFRNKYHFDSIGKQIE
jgi:hypothetical protein